MSLLDSLLALKMEKSDFDWKAQCECAFAYDYGKNCEGFSVRLNMVSKEVDLVKESLKLATYISEFNTGFAMCAASSSVPERQSHAEVNDISCNIATAVLRFPVHAVSFVGFKDGIIAVDTVGVPGAKAAIINTLKSYCRIRNWDENQFTESNHA